MVELHLGDCKEVMAGMPDGCIDLTVTSPPYDNLRKYKGYTFDFEPIARQLYRVTKPGGVVVWVVGDATINGSETGTSFRQALYFKEIGFNLHDTMIYEKINFIPLTHRRFEQCFEFMFVLSKGAPKTFNPLLIPTTLPGQTYNWGKKGYGPAVKEGAQRRRNENTVTKVTKIRRNIWQYPTGGNRVGHPAPFPEDLARDHILSWSNPGDTILDPMVGSGTTGKIAIKYDRNFIGIDIARDYLEISEKQIQPMKMQPSLLEVK